MPRLEVFKHSDGQWGWRLKASNGKTVAQGEGYRRRSGALAGAKALQRAAARARAVMLG